MSKPAETWSSELSDSNEEIAEYTENSTVGTSKSKNYSKSVRSSTDRPKDAAFQGDQSSDLNESNAEIAFNTYRDPITRYNQYIMELNGFSIAYAQSVIARQMRPYAIAASMVTTSQKYLDNALKSMNYLVEHDDEQLAIYLSDMIKSLNDSDDSNIGALIKTIFLKIRIYLLEKKVSALDEQLAHAKALSIGLDMPGAKLPDDYISNFRKYNLSEISDIDSAIYAAKYNLTKFIDKMNQITREQLIDYLKKALRNVHMENIFGGARLHSTIIKGSINPDDISKIDKFEAPNFVDDIAKSHGDDIVNSDRLMGRFAKDVAVAVGETRMNKLIGNFRLKVPVIFTRSSELIMNWGSKLLKPIFFSGSLIFEACNAYFSIKDAMREAALFLNEDDIKDAVMEAIENGQDITVDEARSICSHLLAGLVSEKRLTVVLNILFSNYEVSISAEEKSIFGILNTENYNKMSQPVKEVIAPNATKVLSMIDYLCDDSENGSGYFPLFSLINLIDGLTSIAALLSMSPKAVAIIGKIPLLKKITPLVSFTTKRFIVIGVVLLILDGYEKIAETKIVDGFITNYSITSRAIWNAVKMDLKDDQILNNSYNWQN